MRRSIRMRFTCTFLAVIAAVLLAAFLMNTFGLERFYRKQKLKEIEAAYEVLNEIVMEEGAESSRLQTVLEEYSNTHNISIAVVDSANSKSLQSTERSGDFLFRRIQKYLFNMHCNGDIFAEYWRPFTYDEWLRNGKPINDGGVKLDDNTEHLETFRY